MNFIVIIALFFTGVFKLDAQSLIHDPGFEEVEFMFDGKDTIYVYTHWQSLLPFSKKSFFGHPKYSKYELRTDSKSAKDAWKPYEGDSQFIAQHLNLKNLYQTKLVRPLKKGKCYKLTFMYRIIAKMMTKEQIESRVNHKVGGRFTVNSLYSEENLTKFLSNDFKYPPHFTIDDFTADSISKWMEFVYEFTADMPYEYLTIGNFLPIARTGAEAALPYKGVSYRIDLVSLIETDSQESSISELTSIEYSYDLVDNVEPNEFTINTQLSASASSYYRRVFNAESFILDGRSDSAIRSYISAFEYQKPKFREYQNVKSIEKKEEVSDTKILSSLVKQLFLPKPELIDLSQKIDSIFRLDQDIRSTDFSNVPSQDSANLMFLLSHVDNNDISEHSIGINSMRNLEVLLLHLSRYSFFEALIPILVKQVENGNFDNRQFASLVDSYYSNTISGDRIESYYYTTSAYPLFTQFVIPVLDPNLMEEINIRRHRIGLESLEDQYRKQFYNFKYGYRDFEFYQFFSYFPTEEFCTEEEKAKYLEKEKDKVAELKQQYAQLIIWSK